MIIVVVKTSGKCYFSCIFNNVDMMYPLCRSILENYFVCLYNKKY
jgi:hypothetical protein